MINITSLAQSYKRAPWRYQLLHSADDSRTIWITHGQGRAILAGRRWGVGGGNLIYVPAGSSLSLEITHNTTGRVLTFSSFRDDLWPDRATIYRSRDMTMQAEIASLLEAIHKEGEDHKVLADEAMESHLQLTAIWLQRKLNAEGAPPRPGASERLITAFLALIEAQYWTGVPMAAYAEQLGVTATHLSRACREKLGRTAADLLTERTLHAARVALETSEEPIKQIASTLGFGSPAYFSRFILNHTGQSPSILRTQAESR